MTELLQRADFDMAVLIALGLVIVVVLALIGRRGQPAPPRTTTSSAVPADLSAIEAEMTAVKGRLFEVEHTVSELHHNVAQVRTMLGALPTKDSVHQLALSVARVEGDLKVNNTQTETTAKTVERIMNWLMEDAKTKAGGK